MKNKPSCILKIILGAVAMLFLVAGIPIIINEAYKCNSGYMTLWGAADVLSYYGNLLGAASAFVVLSITILFTMSQIRRDSYIKSETAKWKGIETAFVKAITEIHPMGMLREVMDCGFTDPTRSISILQKYQMACQLATDQLNMCLSTTDFPKVKELVDAIRSVANNLTDTTQEEIDIYSKLRNLTTAKTAQDTLDLEMKYPNSFPPDTLLFCKQTVKNAEGVNLEELEQLIHQANTKLIDLYKTKYTSILQLKGATFDRINVQIQQIANEMLHIWRKPE